MIITPFYFAYDELSIHDMSHLIMDLREEGVEVVEVPETLKFYFPSAWQRAVNTTHRAALVVTQDKKLYFYEDIKHFGGKSKAVRVNPRDKHRIQDLLDGNYKLIEVENSSQSLGTVDTIYRTSDGKIFEDSNSAVDHEESLKLSALVDKVSNDLNMNPQFVHDVISMLGSMGKLV